MLTRMSCKRPATSFRSFSRRIARGRSVQPGNTVQRSYTRSWMNEELQTAAEGTAPAQELETDLLERATLVIYQGSGSDARTRVVELPDGAEVSFGRSRACTVHIDSASVSRNHARLT